MLGWLHRGAQVEWERNARGSECERGWKRSGTVFSCEIDYCTGVYVVYSIETNENERGKHETIRKTRKESKKALITKGNMRNLKNGELGGLFRGVDRPQMVTKGRRYLSLVVRKSSQVTGHR